MKPKEIFMAVSILLICFLISVSFCAVKLSSEQKSNMLATRRVIDFRIDSSFSTQQIFQIQNALKKWENATHGHVILSSFVDDVSIFEIIDWKKDNYPTIYNAQSVWSWKNTVAKFGEADPDMIGVTFTFSGDIFIVGNELFKTVVLHEIGHVLLGDWHSDHKEELMYPTISESKNISEREALFVQIFTR